MKTNLKRRLLSSNRLARAVLIAGLAFTATTLMPTTASFAAAPAPTASTASTASKAETLAEFRAVLVKYGTFGKHEKYGEIWVPTVTPQGWHPYPACQWVYTKDGWYFNDETEWGTIVHHHGRWSHDEKIGWFWVPDEDWSPGWVVWRKSDKWVGWAPMPPEQDSYLVSQPEFNNDKLWIFMDAKKFFNVANGHTATHDQAAVGFADNVGGGLMIVTSGFADDFFDEILDGGETGDEAVLVDDDGHGLIALAHFAHQVGAGLGFGNEQGGANDLPDSTLHKILVGDVQQILGIDDAKNVIK